MICIFTHFIYRTLNKKVLKFEIDLDFVLVAITSQLKDYRVCYYINKETGFKFNKTEDLRLDKIAQPEPSFFSMYDYQPDGAAPYFVLLVNKGTEGYLIPEMNKTDFWLLVKNYIADNEVDRLVSTINKIPGVISAVKVDPKKIKSRENLLF